MLLYQSSLSTLLSIKGYVPEVGFVGGVYLFLISVFSVPEQSQIPPLVCNAHVVKDRDDI